MEKTLTGQTSTLSSTVVSGPYYSPANAQLTPDDVTTLTTLSPTIQALATAASGSTDVATFSATLISNLMDAILRQARGQNLL